MLRTPRLRTDFLSAAILCHLYRSASCFLPAARHVLHETPARKVCSDSAALRMASPVATHFYPVGMKGVPWKDEERVAWRAQHAVKRSYRMEVLDKVEALRESGKFVVEQYGALSCNPDRYPVVVIKSKAWNVANPTLLVTGGVHGYETSGVQGSILFLETKAAAYSSSFNVVVAPCVSPWGYECIQRWNTNADDPNRGFLQDVERPRDECVLLMRMLDKLRFPSIYLPACQPSAATWQIPDSFCMD